MNRPSPLPPLPWLKHHDLVIDPGLGPGLDPDALLQGLTRLCAADDVRAVVVFGSRARGQGRPDSDLDLAVICATPSLTPEQRLERWTAYRDQLGDVGVDVDLLVKGWKEAEYLSGSRWHVMGDVARQCRVLYVSR